MRICVSGLGVIWKGKCEKKEIGFAESCLQELNWRFEDEDFEFSWMSMTNDNMT